MTRIYTTQIERKCFKPHPSCDLNAINNQKLSTTKSSLTPYYTLYGTKKQIVTFSVFDIF